MFKSKDPLREVMPHKSAEEYYKEICNIFFSTLEDI